VSALVVEDWPVSRLADERHAWSRLANTAIEPNPYFAPRILEAQAQHLRGGDAIRCRVVHDGTSLLGLWPWRPRGGWYGFRRVAAIWSSPFAMSGAPLLARSRAAEAARTLLADQAQRTGKGLGTGSGTGLGLLLCRNLQMDGPAATCLLREARALGFEVEEAASYRRAVLEVTQPWPAYAATRLDGKRRRKMRRIRSRLEDMGRLTHEVATGGPSLEGCLAAFLDLEKRGWKGQRGTAMACTPRTDALARAFFTPDGLGPGLRGDMLRLDGRPVAVSLAFVSGGTGFFVKTTFDEDLRRAAPGLVLEEEIMRSCLDGGTLTRLDSASFSGCVLEDLWDGRSTIADILFVSPAAGETRARASEPDMERRRREMVARLKSAHAWCRARWAA
jgi:CelD/BcsL family acetyltransferase involved in cellulose biosynthesis